MIKKTLCFSNKTQLSLKLGQLVIRLPEASDEHSVITRPIEDIGIIVLESHFITITSALMACLAENNVAVIICNDKHIPSAMMLPLSYNSQTTKKANAQIASSQPLKKQLWQQTVSAKISNQGALLAEKCSKETGCMAIWAKNVKSGDKDNLEARAAVFYWKNLFSEDYDFARGDDTHLINPLLNYGYAILRAVVARAIVATGLIPSIGLFHSNKYNPYCLADDIMEPYRPYVDKKVCEIIDLYGRECGLTKEIKKELLSIPVVDVKINNLRRPLMVAVTITVASLAKCYCGEIRKISYPDM